MSTTPPSSAAPAAGRPALTAAARRVLIGTCLNALGNGFVLPFLVIYLHEVRRIPLSTTGAIVAIQGAVGLVAVPVYGALIDRVGARPVQLATLTLSTSGALSLAFATHAGTAAVAVALLGLGGAGLWPAGQALVAEVVPSALRGRFYGVNFMLLNLGIGLGGLLGAAVVRPGHPGTYQALFVGDAATFAGFLVVLAGLRGVGRRIVAEQADEVPAASYRLLVRDPAFRAVVLLQLVLVLVGYSQLDSGFPAFARQVGVSPRLVGIAFAANTFTIVAAQLAVQRRIDGHRRTRVLAGVVGLWLVAWAVLGSAWLVHRSGGGAAVAGVAIAFNVVFAAGEMLLSPTMPALVNDLAPAHVRGRWNAAMSWSWAVANTVGPVLAGLLLGAHLAGVWLALLGSGCVAAAWLAARAERHLGRADRGAGVVSSPSPVSVAG